MAQVENSRRMVALSESESKSLETWCLMLRIADSKNSLANCLEPTGYWLAEDMKASSNFDGACGSVGSEGVGVGLVEKVAMAVWMESAMVGPYCWWMARMEMEEVPLVFVRMRVLLVLRNMPAGAMRLWNSDKKNVPLRRKGKHFCRLHTPWEWILRHGNCLLGSLGLVWLLLVVGEGQRLGQLQ
jgi:hypothetical protein